MPLSLPSLRSILVDARTEWALRWTALTTVAYATYFYPPISFDKIDWSLPIQLVQGGNLAFYNVGFHYWFGLMAVVSLAIAGCLLSILLPLLQQDQLGASYVILMALLTVLITPCVTYLGVLTTFNGIALLMISIFTENIYGPVLNLRDVLVNQGDLWTLVVSPSISASFVYVAYSLGIYMIPPWHSGIQQSLSTSSHVASGMGGVLREAAATLSEDGDNKETSSKDDNDNDDDDTRRQCLRQLGRQLFQETNCAGMSVPLNLFGECGAYEWSILYPLRSFSLAKLRLLSKRLDEAIFHLTLVLALLGMTNALDEIQGVQEEVVEYIEASAELSDAVSAVLSRPRKDWSDPDGPKIVRRKLENAYTRKMLTTVEVQEQLERAQKRCQVASETLQTAVQDLEQPSPKATLLWILLRDMSQGNRRMMHFHNDEIAIGDGGMLRRLSHAATELQSSWSDKCTTPRLVVRMTMLEQCYALVAAWFKGVISIGRFGRTEKKGMSSCYSLLKKRGFRRAVQWLVGTWSLYAMATWYDDYRTLLGSSSTGQWTMVAFYVCFRSTVEETVNTSILRAVGHALGALLAWGINTWATTSKARMVAHAIITFVMTWLIPPPFVYPSKIKLVSDPVLGTGLLEGIATTYHLTSSLVPSTDVESAAKARAISQCIGAAAAAVISLLILPWWAQPQAEAALQEFKAVARAALVVLTTKNEETSQSRLAVTGALKVTVDNLLQARRDWGSVQESQQWITQLVRSLPFASSPDSNLNERLLMAVIGGVALESLLIHVSKDLDGGLPDDAKEALKRGDGAQAAQVLLNEIHSMDPSDVKSGVHRDALAICHVSVVVMGSCSMFLKEVTE